MHTILCLLLLFVFCYLNLLQLANASPAGSAESIKSAKSAGSASSAAHGGKKKMLIFAPNSNPSHYQLHKKLALIATELKNIEVCILIMERGNEIRKLSNGEPKRIREMTNSEHQEVEDKDLAAKIGTNLKVMYFDGKSLRTAAGGTLTKRRSKSGGSSAKSKRPSRNPSITSQRSSKRGRSPSEKKIIGSSGAGAESAPSSSHPKKRTKRASPPASPSKKSHNIGEASLSSRSKSPKKAKSERSKSRSKSPSQKSVTVQGKKSDFSSMWNTRDHEALRRGNDPKTFISLAIEDKFMQVLKDEHFTIGLAEVWEAGAFYIFEMLEIKKIVATSAMPSQSVFYSWLGNDFLDQVIAHKIPELWTAPHTELTMFGKHYANLDALHKFSVKRAEDVFRGNDADYCLAAQTTKQAPPSPEIGKNKKGKKKIPGKKFFTKLFNMCKRVVVKKAAKEAKGKEVVRGESSIVASNAQQHHGSGPPMFKGFFQKASYYFVNTQPSINYAVPKHNKLSYIGGITMDNSKKQELNHAEQAVLKLVKDRKYLGLVLGSFGSQLKSADIPVNVLEAIRLLAMKEEKYLFLWKFDDIDAILKKPPNLRVVTWMSQPTLLAEPVTKLFISHCGINSVLEAAQHGVPLLCMPLSFDQFYNAAAIKHHGAAEVLNKDILVKGPPKVGGVEHLLEGFHKVIGNKEMHQKMTNIKDALHKTSPKQEFLKKLDHLLKE